MSDRTRAFRPRLSLLSLLLLTALIGAGITIASLWREVGPLRAEVRRTHELLGLLDIGDPSLVHAIRVFFPHASDVRRFRIYVPEGRRYCLCWRGNGLSKQGHLPPKRSWPLEPGEHLIEIKTEKKYYADSERVDISTVILISEPRLSDIVVDTIEIDGGDLEVLRYDGLLGAGDVKDTQSTFSPIQRVDLCRLLRPRVTRTLRQADGRILRRLEAPDEHGNPGLHCWIEPEPEVETLPAPPPSR